MNLIYRNFSMKLELNGFNKNEIRKFIQYSFSRIKVVPGKRREEQTVTWETSVVVTGDWWQWSSEPW